MIQTDGSYYRRNFDRAVRIRVRETRCFVGCSKTARRHFCKCKWRGTNDKKGTELRERGDGVCYVKGRSRNAPPVEQTRKRRVPTLPTLGCQAVNVFHPSIRNYRGCRINDVVTAFIISRWPRKHLRNFRRGDVGSRSSCLDVIGAEKRVSRVTGE